jgi:hypothetical protein
MKLYLNKRGFIWDLTTVTNSMYSDRCLYPFRRIVIFDAGNGISATPFFQNDECKVAGKYER